MKFSNLKADSSSSIKGIFHCSGPTGYTKYEMSCIMADIYNLPKDHIQSDMSEANKPEPSLRPDNVQLDTSISYELLEFQPIIEFKDSIKECLENFI